MRDGGSAPEISVALVGAGAISEVHLRALSRLQGVRVMAIADPDLAAAERRAARYAIGATYTSLAELLEHEVPGAVHILSPPSTHAELAIRALEAGAHVYVEKPMARTEEACRRMAAAADSAGRLICVGHSIVHDPLFRRAAANLASGELGELVLAAFALSYDAARHPGLAQADHWSRSLPGGLLEDLAVHPASALLALLGEIRETARVPAHDAAADGQRTEVLASLEGERGLGVLSVSLRSRPADTVLRIHGTRGVLRLDYSNRTLTRELERRRPTRIDRGLRNLRLAAQLTTQTATQTARYALGRLDASGGVKTLVTKFYRALRADAAAPVPADDGVRVVRLLRSLWPVKTSSGGARPEIRASRTEGQTAP